MSSSARRGERTGKSSTRARRTLVGDCERGSFGTLEVEPVAVVLYRSLIEAFRDFPHLRPVGRRAADDPEPIAQRGREAGRIVGAGDPEDAIGAEIEFEIIVVGPRRPASAPGRDSRGS